MLKSLKIVDWLYKNLADKLLCSQLIKLLMLIKIISSFLILTTYKAPRIIYRNKCQIVNMFSATNLLPFIMER